MEVAGARMVQSYQVTIYSYTSGILWALGI
jgi:hypothetical protein